MGSSLSVLLGRLRFRHLALLAALDEHRNLHRAAVATHMSQPSATKVVHELERMLGLRMFDRLPTGMRPTEFGVVVIEFANRALADLRRLAVEADGRKVDRNGRLIIGTPMGVVIDCITRAVAVIKQRRPTLIIKMRSASSEEILAGVMNGLIDLGVGYFNGLGQLGAVGYERLGSDELCVAVRKHHPLLREQRLNVRELQRATWILHPLGTFAEESMGWDFDKIGMKAPANVVESDSISGTLRMVLASDAVTLLPESIIQDQLQSNFIARLPLAIAGNSVEFGMLSRRGEPLAPALRDCQELLRRLGSAEGRSTENKQLGVAG
jgi:DNA-binding transcriptional LysR family regulator